MYAWLWRSLPGARWLRVLILLLPATAPHMPFNDITVDE